LASRPTVHFGYGFFRLFGIRERRFRAPAAICGPLQSAYNAIEKKGPAGTESVEKGIPQIE